MATGLEVGAAFGFSDSSESDSSASDFLSTLFFTAWVSFLTSSIFSAAAFVTALIFSPATLAEASALSPASLAADLTYSA